MGPYIKMGNTCEHIFFPISIFTFDREGRRINKYKARPLNHWGGGVDPKPQVTSCWAYQCESSVNVNKVWPALGANPRRGRPQVK